MQFLRSLFGGGPRPARQTGDPDGLYYFVRPHGCEEVVRVRINRNNDLSLTDDGSGYLVHKHVRGVKCRQGVELDLYYNSKRQLVNAEVSGGALVTEADYQAWLARQQEEASADKPSAGVEAASTGRADVSGTDADTNSTSKTA
ncbi:MAG: hypothetical protein SNJ59_17140 [Aggregatilineales bacterium]